MKTCRKCKKEKPTSEFFKEKGGLGGLRSACKSCRQLEYEAWKAKVLKDPDYIDKNRKRVRLRNLWKKHGVTEEKYNSMFVLQEGKCAICGTHQKELSKALCVDHSHITGEIRGLLCTCCNTSLGLLKEDVVLLQAMQEYIHQYSKPKPKAK